MRTASIEEKQETDNGWQFSVAIDGHSYTVTLTRAYWRELSGGTIEPEELVKRSFAFLLEREPAGDILSTFDLSVIQQYFPEYEIEVKKDLES